MSLIEEDTAGELKHKRRNRKRKPKFVKDGRRDDNNVSGVNTVNDKIRGSVAQPLTYTKPFSTTHNSTSSPDMTHMEFRREEGELVPLSSVPQTPAMNVAKIRDDPETPHAPHTPRITMTPHTPPPVIKATKHRGNTTFARIEARITSPTPSCSSLSYALSTETSLNRRQKVLDDFQAALSVRNQRLDQSISSDADNASSHRNVMTCLSSALNMFTVVERSSHRSPCPSVPGSSSTLPHAHPILRTAEYKLTRPHSVMTTGLSAFDLSFSQSSSRQMSPETPTKVKKHFHSHHTPAGSKSKTVVVIAPPTHTQSRKWVSPPRADQDTWYRIQKHFVYNKFNDSPFVPKDFRSYIQHKTEMLQVDHTRQLKKIEILEAQEQSKVAKVMMPPMGGRQFSDGHGAVFGAKTIWCPLSWRDKNQIDKEAMWPSIAELKWEGDERLTKDSYGRFLPVPRVAHFDWLSVKGNPLTTFGESTLWDGQGMVPWQERRFVIPHRFDVMMGSVGFEPDMETIYDRPEEIKGCDKASMVGWGLLKAVEED